jgi:hypothetical protein
MAFQVERLWEFMARGLDFDLAFGDFILCPAEDSTSYLVLAMYFQLISLDS